MMPDYFLKINMVVYKPQFTKVMLEMRTQSQFCSKMAYVSRHNQLVIDWSHGTSPSPLFPAATLHSNTVKTHNLLTLLFCCSYPKVV